MKGKSPRRWRKALWAIAGLLVVSFAAVVVLLPAWINSTSGRKWLLQRANAVLRPGRIEFAGLRVSWWGATRLSGVTLRDPQGDAVVSCPEVAWDRSLLQILFQRPRLGTFRLDGARVDIERRDDGTIDLVEAIRPILNGTPATDWTLKMAGASLRIRDPHLATPVAAETLDLEIRRPAAPGKITWAVALKNHQGHSLDVSGHLDRWDGRAPGDNGLAVLVKADSWDVPIRSGSVVTAATLSGTLDARRPEGSWEVAGDLDASRLDLSGLPGTEGAWRLGELRSRWSARESASGWTLANLQVNSRLGAFRADRPFPPPEGETSAIVGSIDLPAFLATLPFAASHPTIDRGRAELTIRARSEKTRQVVTIEAHVRELIARTDEATTHLKQPATLAVTLVRDARGVDLRDVALDSAFAKAKGSGDLDAGIAVAGTLDLAPLREQASEWVDLGSLAATGQGAFSAHLRRVDGAIRAEFSGDFADVALGPEADPWRLSGLTLSGAMSPASLAPKGWDLRIGVASAARAGLDLGAATLHAASGPEGPTIDPIDTTLNGGKLRLVPKVVTGATPVLSFLPGTELVNASVNEQATRRVLAFVAPVLDGATRVEGKVSARIDRAEFPLRKDVARTTVVEGKIVFHDLTFTPGPLTRTLLDLVGRDDGPVHLDQPVVLAISDGVVHTRGLAVPVGKLTAVEVEGDVGFDKSLNLVATLPLTPAMFPNGGVVGDVVSGTRVTVPIRGTLDHPQVDRDAFKAGLARSGKEMLQRGAARGAAELLFRLARPRDPNAPPPLTPAERKAQRLEKRAERRGGPS